MKLVGIDDQLKKELSDAYKNVSVDREILRMEEWLASPKGKSRTGTLAFVKKWLSNQSTRAPVVIPIRDPEIEAALIPSFQEYLKDLWKNREHLLQLNTTTRKS